MPKAGNIYSGIGGWTYEPWRGVFYPKGLPHARELSYAAERLTSIEVNGTFYRSQTPATFRKWASEVPSDFVFALKGPRLAVNRRVLHEAGDSVKRFIDSGIVELGDRLGPLLWQFAPHKKFDEADFGGFLELLPDKIDGRRLRHVVEVRHDSFCTPAFIALLRRSNTPVVFAEHATYPAIADVTGDFVYARLQKGEEKLKQGYPPKTRPGMTMPINAHRPRPRWRPLYAAGCRRGRYARPNAKLAVASAPGRDATRRAPEVYARERATLTNSSGNLQRRNLQGTWTVADDARTVGPDIAEQVAGVLLGAAGIGDDVTVLAGDHVLQIEPLAQRSVRRHAVTPPRPHRRRHPPRARR
jgi:uncharacterized protein YecE (DUF72 family)